MNPMVRATLAYFGMVFGAGFLLGPIRQWILTPRVGGRLAELIEFPIMLVVLFVAAHFLVRKFGEDVSGLRWVWVGTATTLLILVADLLVGVWLRGMTLRQIFLERDPVTGTIYYAMLALLAVCPWALARRLSCAS